MDKISECKFAGIDFESANTRNGSNDEAIQIGIAQMDENLTIEKNELFSSYIAPKEKIKKNKFLKNFPYSKLHNAPKLLQLWQDINKRLQSRVVVAHSISVEKKFLSAFPMHDFGPWVDSLSVARSAYPDFKSHKLGYLVEKLNLNQKLNRLCPNLSWHDALYDAVASLLIVKHVVNEFSLQNNSLNTIQFPKQNRYFRTRKL